MVIRIGAIPLDGADGAKQSRSRAAVLARLLPTAVVRSVAALALAAALVPLSPAPASAGFNTTTTTTTDTSLLDPLHGYCSVGCVDNQTNSPTTQNPITGFGFTISPGPNTGINFLIDVLVPDNEASSPASFHITGTASDGTTTRTVDSWATLFSSTEWKSNPPHNNNPTLDSYLGLITDASPPNKIGAYLPATQTLDSGATGFYVYQVDLGKTLLQDAGHGNKSPLLDITGLPLGSYIVGYLNIGTASTPDWIATANSGAIFETRRVPEPASLALLSAGLVGFGLAQRLRRRRKSIAGRLSS